MKHLAKIAVTLLISLFLLFSLCLKRAQATITNLDVTFGNAGKVTTDFSGEENGIRGMALQADGKIVVAGYSGIYPAIDFALARYNGDGSLDSSFGIGGRVKTDAGGLDAAHAIALQPDGKIVTAGVGVFPNQSLITLMRHNPDGSPDATFGIGGVVVLFAHRTAQANAVLIQADGKIVFAAQQIGQFGSIWLVGRLHTNGTPDFGFGASGTVLVNLGGGDIPFAVAQQADGKLVVGGYADAGANQSDFALVRFHENGSLDSSFDGDGIVTTDLSSASNVFFALTIQPDGKIVGAGQVASLITESQVALARYHPDGSLDSSFGVGGKTTTDFASGVELASAIVRQSDGKLVIAGVIENATPAQDFLLARYDSNGNLDMSFGNGGFVRTDFIGERERTFAAAIQADGRILVAGNTQTPGNMQDFALARYNSNNFDVCLQDDSNHQRLQFNSTTGEYQFTSCTGVTLGGVGMLSKRGAAMTLKHETPDRRLSANLDTNNLKGAATLQLFSPKRNFSITDRNISNNTCACP